MRFTDDISVLISLAYQHSNTRNRVNKFKTKKSTKNKKFQNETVREKNQGKGYRALYISKLQELLRQIATHWFSEL